MSRKYEGLLILNAKGLEGSIEDLVSAVGKEIEAEGGKLEEVQQMGRKKFAYPSNKLDGGHYVSYLFDAEPEVIEKINAKLKLNTQVHQQYYQLR
ncbi:30S ribosomal protein S6 [Haloferula sp.]|uniref:30S ribosomal protein S6 n=1 Tax=Haloferula sp. TaxID=2497595 RepID=UPI003C78A8D6